MNITVAIDSLKGSLTSMEAGEAIKEGILRVCPNSLVNVRPLADGGEGTAYALTVGMNGEWIQMQATGPLGEFVDCSYGILQESKTAIMEMATVAGITLVPMEKRNPLNTTTYGVGEMICDAIKRGCRKFIVGIGGSATNDGGVGMLQALGYDFLDKEGKQISFGAKGLADLESISDDNVIAELSECSFRVACDVTNPLCGELGCSAVYGPQKGATPDMIEQMDQWLSNYATLTKQKYPQIDQNQQGTGAAGGLGFAFLSYMNAMLESGVKIVLEETQLRDYIKEADIVITGEGRLDAQTVMGKAPMGVAKLAKEYGKTVIAFAGSVTKDALACNEHGIDAYFPILREVMTIEEAMDKQKARENMMDAVEQVFRLIQIISTKYKF